MGKKWNIPVSWEMCGVVSVEADTLEEAINIANNDDSIELPSGHYVDSSFAVSIDDPDSIRQLYNGKQPDKLRNLSYCDTVKYAVENIQSIPDFYIDFTQADKHARLHIYVNNIAGTDWYNAASEFFNGKEFVISSSCSDKDLNDFKHAVGVCWHNIQNTLGHDFSSRIQAASERAAKASDTENQKTAFQSMRTPHR